MELTLTRASCSLPKVKIFLTPKHYAKHKLLIPNSSFLIPNS